MILLDGIIKPLKGLFIDITMYGFYLHKVDGVTVTGREEFLAINGGDWVCSGVLFGKVLL